MALYLLNISADTADLPSNSIHENLAINDQESFIEIFIEQILGYENAIMELNDADPQDVMLKKTAKVKLLLNSGKVKAPKVLTSMQRISNYPKYPYLILMGHSSLEEPPPKQLI